jgi:hypothetical protein
MERSNDLLRSLLRIANRPQLGRHLEVLGPADVLLDPQKIIEGDDPEVASRLLDTMERRRDASTTTKSSSAAINRLSSSRN